MIKKHYIYLDQLINTDYGYYKSKVAATTEFIPEEMVQVDFKILGDRFLLFDIDELVGYFDSDAWAAVKMVADLKKLRSTCVTCKEYCLSACVNVKHVTNGIILNV
jgi:hypothetical protein